MALLQRFGRIVILFSLIEFDGGEAQRASYGIVVDGRSDGAGAIGDEGASDRFEERHVE